MKATRTLLLTASTLALAFGAAYAGGDAKNKSASSGASASARLDFDKADKNKDGKVSRAEFDEVMKANASSGGTSKAHSPSSGKTADKPSSSSK
jgi:EF hand